MKDLMNTISKKEYYQKNKIQMIERIKKYMSDLKKENIDEFRLRNKVYQLRHKLKHLTGEKPTELIEESRVRNKVYKLIHKLKKLTDEDPIELIEEYKISFELEF